MYTDYNELTKENSSLWVGDYGSRSPISARLLCPFDHTNKMLEIPSHLVPESPEEVDLLFTK